MAILQALKPLRQVELLVGYILHHDHPPLGCPVTVLNNLLHPISRPLYLEQSLVERVFVCSSQLSLVHIGKLSHDSSVLEVRQSLWRQRVLPDVRSTSRLFKGLCTLLVGALSPSFIFFPLTVVLVCEVLDSRLQCLVSLFHGFLMFVKRCHVARITFILPLLQMKPRSLDASVALLREGIREFLLPNSKMIKALVQMLILLAELTVVTLSSSHELPFVRIFCFQRLDLPLFVPASHLRPTRLAAIEHSLRSFAASQKLRHDLIRMLLQCPLSSFTDLLVLLRFLLGDLSYLHHLLLSGLHKISDSLLAFLLLLHAVVLHHLLLQFENGKVLRLFLTHAPQRFNVCLFLLVNRIHHDGIVHGRAGFLQAFRLRTFAGQIQDITDDPSSSPFKEVVPNVAEVSLLEHVSSSRFNVCSARAQHLHGCLCAWRAQVEHSILWKRNDGSGSDSHGAHNTRWPPLPYTAYDAQGSPDFRA
mmetsp:Transcript_45033/g.104309  ORF Transcript_45033/g.104309 Transcript_45033/m.104309 type:complete len:475 (-) Transcript_45033:3-1427(-)